MTIAGNKLFNPVRARLDRLVFGDSDLGDLGLGLGA